MFALLWLSKYYSLLSQVVYYVTFPISFLRQLLFLPRLNNYFILFFICIISLTFNSLSQIIFYMVKQRVYQSLPTTPHPRPHVPLFYWSPSQSPSASCSNVVWVLPLGLGSALILGCPFSQEKGEIHLTSFLCWISFSQIPCLLLWLTSSFCWSTSSSSFLRKGTWEVKFWNLVYLKMSLIYHHSWMIVLQGVEF